MLMKAMANRNSADALVLMTPPTAFIESKRDVSADAANATPTDMRTTIAEWPSEKKRPTPTGRWPCCISLRVTLSIAAI